jgi:hypothetical protein
MVLLDACTGILWLDGKQIQWVAPPEALRQRESEVELELEAAGNRRPASLRLLLRPLLFALSAPRFFFLTAAFLLFPGSLDLLLLLAIFVHLAALVVNRHIEAPCHQWVLNDSYSLVIRSGLLVRRLAFPLAFLLPQLFLVLASPVDLVPHCLIVLVLLLELQHEFMLL